TAVQTCALPIYAREHAARPQGAEHPDRRLDRILQEHHAAVAVFKAGQPGQAGGKALAVGVQGGVVHALPTAHDRHLVRMRRGCPREPAFAACGHSAGSASSLRATKAPIAAMLSRFSGTTSSSSTTKPKSCSSQVTSSSTPIESMTPDSSRLRSAAGASPGMAGGKFSSMKLRTWASYWLTAAS